MHEMLVFGIEINTCVVGVYAYICVHILTQMLVMRLLACAQAIPEKWHRMLTTLVVFWKIVGMTFHCLSFVFWNFVPCTCIIYSKINSF